MYSLPWLPSYISLPCEWYIGWEPWKAIHAGLWQWPSLELPCYWLWCDLFAFYSNSYISFYCNAFESISHCVDTKSPITQLPTNWGFPTSPFPLQPSLSLPNPILGCVCCFPTAYTSVGVVGQSSLSIGICYHTSQWRKWTEIQSTGCSRSAVE